MESSSSLPSSLESKLLWLISVLPPAFMFPQLRRHSNHHLAPFSISEGSSSCYERWVTAKMWEGCVDKLLEVVDVEISTLPARNAAGRIAFLEPVFS